MKRVILGWLIMLIGVIPLVLTLVLSMQELSFAPMKEYLTLIIVGLVVFVVGFVIKEWGNKSRDRVNKV